jgi:uncharacterized protein (DUF2267 family)
MTMTGLDSFDAAVNTANIWLHDVMEEMKWTDRHKAYYALRAVLHTLRDRLPVNEAVDLGAQLPMLIRGFYYEGWHPANKPLKERSRDEFLAHIGDAFLFDVEADAVAITKAVLRVLASRVTLGEIEDVRHVLPKHIRELWP